MPLIKQCIRINVRKKRGNDKIFFNKTDIK